MTLQPCSRCGGNVFVKHTQVTGTWVSIHEIQNGELVQTEGIGDSVRHLKEPKTIRCDNCGKRVKNPDFR